MIEIPHTELSQEALLNLIDEFITRDSTITDATLDQKRSQVLKALEGGTARITFDSETETAHIWLVDELRSGT